MKTIRKITKKNIIRARTNFARYIYYYNLQTYDYTELQIKVLFWEIV